MDCVENEYGVQLDVQVQTRACSSFFFSACEPSVSLHVFMESEVFFHDADWRCGRTSQRCKDCEKSTEERIARTMHDKYHFASRTDSAERSTEQLERTGHAVQGLDEDTHESEESKHDKLSLNKVSRNKLSLTKFQTMMHSQVHKSTRTPTNATLQASHIVRAAEVLASDTCVRVCWGCFP